MEDREFLNFDTRFLEGHASAWPYGTMADARRYIAVRQAFLDKY